MLDARSVGFMIKLYLRGLLGVSLLCISTEQANCFDALPFTWVFAGRLVDRYSVIVCFDEGSDVRAPLPAKSMRSMEGDFSVWLVHWLELGEY